MNFEILKPRPKAQGNTNIFIGDDDFAKRMKQVHDMRSRPIKMSSEEARYYSREESGERVSFLPCLTLVAQVAKVFPAQYNPAVVRHNLQSDSQRLTDVAQP
ncbi:hypothetical protein KIN20_030910 [Parelaphostrongylus tenuis]|uniref:Uncharacterized protein n=1 Tax=Parelaphostrongylus tenuis TaxID=148309 RepID=A0AAD5R626_PARTN|nr:hypothetical protein KIN20_030910 [Parelaphostrongylus tenuis]